MTDAAYILKQDTYEKKAAARGAYHKRCGSKSKYCSLPSDKLTKAERKKMNGEIHTYNINKRLTWGEFKLLPPDLQARYLCRLKHKYGANLTEIAKSLGVTMRHLGQYIKNNPDAPNFPRGGAGGSADDNPEWQAFLRGEEYTPQVVEEPAAPEEIPPVAEEPAVIRVFPGEGSLTFNTITLDQFAEAIKTILNPDAPYAFILQFREEVAQS